MHTQNVDVAHQTGSIFEYIELGKHTRMAITSVIW